MCWRRLVAACSLCCPNICEMEAVTYCSISCAARAEALSHAATASASWDSALRAVLMRAMMEERLESSCQPRTVHCARAASEPAESRLADVTRRPMPSAEMELARPRLCSAFSASHCNRRVRKSSCSRRAPHSATSSLAELLSTSAARRLAAAQRLWTASQKAALPSLAPSLATAAPSRSAADPSLPAAPAAQLRPPSAEPMPIAARESVRSSSPVLQPLPPSPATSTETLPASSSSPSLGM
mmetsp:Transcript_5600/g.15658  ORF Transcript_5600/g.15658 Transcript_5600/m.15658 type:complete len:242 (-) Transcript_5600:188-913(-)